MKSDAMNKSNRCHEWAVNAQDGIQDYGDDNPHASFDADQAITRAESFSGDPALLLERFEQDCERDFRELGGARNLKCTNRQYTDDGLNALVNHENHYQWRHRS